MKYNYEEVIDILSSVTSDPTKVLVDWTINKSNTPVNTNINNFVYTFPLIINNSKVADITILQFYSSELNRADTMLKYFGYTNYNISFHTFSHDTYFDCFLTIYEDFELPEIVDGFCAKTFEAFDAKGEKFEFSVFYGYTETRNEYNIDDKGVYTFYENDIRIKIDDIKNAWKLGEEINKNIGIRLLDSKIESVINKQ